MRKSRVGHTDEITVSELDGVRYLHFGTPWVQGSMRVKAPHELDLDYARHMMAWLLFHEEPARIVQLGLGAAGLLRWARHYMSGSHVSVVEIEPRVVAVAQSQFRLPAEDEHFELFVEDAMQFVQHPGRAQAYDVIQVDVFDAQARGPALDSLVFYCACQNILSGSGVAVINLFGEVASYAPNMQRIKAAFEDRVLVLPPVQAGNVIALAFGAQAGPWTWTELFARARAIEMRYKLNASGWVEGLKKSADQGLGSAQLIAN